MFRRPGFIPREITFAPDLSSSLVKAAGGIIETTLT
jgi:hypothetical protein